MAEGETPTATLTAEGAPPADTGTTQPQGWVASLPEDLRAAPWLAKYKSADDALRGFGEAQKLIGSKVSVPKDDAPKEEWDRFYASLGRPESPDKYDVPVPAQLPPGVTYTPEQMTEFKALAHTLGLNAKQVKALAEWDMKRALGTADARTRAEAQARTKGESALEQAWGPKDGPVYQRNLELARRLAERAFANDPEVLASLDVQGNNPAFLRGMAELAQMAVEHEYIAGEGAATMPGKEAAEAEYNELQAKVGDDGQLMSGPAWNSRHPRYKETQTRLEQLSRIVWPERRRIA